MKPVFQTLFDERDGNCLQACLASVLELPLSAVPNLIARDDWWKAMNAWLTVERGLELMAFPVGEWKPTGLHLTSGAGSRNMEHVVVSHRGRMVHDPHVAGKGLVEEKTYWVFVALDPSELTGKAK